MNRSTAEIDKERPTRRSGVVRTGAPRTRLAARVDRVLSAALAGEPHVVLNVTAAELMAEPHPVGSVISAALDRAGPGLTGQLRVTEAFRRSGLSDQIFNSLTDPNPIVKAAAARLCGALRLTETVLWIGDLVRDPNPMVRYAALRSLGDMRGRRAVDALMASVDQVATHRLAISLSHAASDLDIETLMRNPPSVKAAVVTVLACGLRRDALRLPPLLGIAQDRRWPKQVRLAACKSLGMIGDAGAGDGLSRLADGDPDPVVTEAASKAWRRLQARTSERST